MSNKGSQRIYLTCGSVFLLTFCFVTALCIVSFGAGAGVEVIAVMSLTLCMAVLLFNSTLLFASQGGPGVLATAKWLLWLSFLLIASAIILCFVSMAGSL